LETNGALQVLNTPEDVQAAKAYVQQARSLGMPVEFWEKQRLTQEIGTEVYEAAFFDPNGGHVHPMKLVHVFKTAAQAARAEVYENTTVAHIEEGREHLLHTTGGHIIRAKSLVLATNAFTARLGFFRNSIVPVHEYVAVTQPFSDQQLAEIGWRKRVPFNDTRTEVFYLGLTEDNRIHIGGGNPSYFFNNGAATTTIVPLPRILRNSSVNCCESTPDCRVSSSKQPGMAWSTGRSTSRLQSVARASITTSSMDSATADTA